MWLNAGKGQASRGLLLVAGSSLEAVIAMNPRSSPVTHVTPKRDKKLQSELRSYSLRNNWVQGAVLETKLTPRATQGHVTASRTQRMHSETPLAWGKPLALHKAPSSAAWDVLAGYRNATLKRPKSAPTGQWSL